MCLKASLAALSLTLTSGTAIAQTQPASAPITLHFDDLRRFDAALADIDAGVEAATAFSAYVESASPGFAGFAARYNTTAETIEEQWRRRPAYYASLSAAKAYLTGRQGEIDSALARLTEMAPAGRPVDAYFFVADQKAGGTPVRMETDAGPAIAVAVGVDMVAVTEDTDMTEFPDGTGGRGGMDDLPQLIVHENAHVLQLAAQGGLQNYRSIYTPEGGSMLAVAVREGCAEYLTYLASGWRMGDRHLYGEANEAALWAEFAAVADQPPFAVRGWFGGRHETHPDYPSQIGYWVGFRICETHHLNAQDPDAAIQDLFSVYAPADIQPMADAYAASLAQR